MKTTHVKHSDCPERWLLFDASEHVLGRMATHIARALMGKDRPTYTPSELGGAHVVVVNAAKAVLSGDKAEKKIYQHYTGYPGGRREIPMRRKRVENPEEIVTLAVRRMLPKTNLGHRMLARLKVYQGAEHRHRAQQPEKVAGTLG